MRQLFAWATAGLVAGLWLLHAGATELRSGGSKATTAPKVCTTEGCGGDFGTSVKFEDSPSLAARKALKEEKLVMVLHVSGSFENPEFT